MEISDDLYLCLVYIPSGRTVSGDLEIHVGATNTTSEPKYSVKVIQQKTKTKDWAKWYRPLLPALLRQRQVDLSESKASLVSISRTAARASQ